MRRKTRSTSKAALQPSESILPAHYRKRDAIADRIIEYRDKLPKSARSPSGKFKRGVIARAHRECGGGLTYEAFRTFFTGKTGTLRRGRPRIFLGPVVEAAANHLEMKAISDNAAPKVPPPRNTPCPFPLPCPHRTPTPHDPTEMCWSYAECDGPGVRRGVSITLHAVPNEEGSREACAQRPDRQGGASCHQPCTNAGLVRQDEGRV